MRIKKQGIEQQERSAAPIALQPVLTDAVRAARIGDYGDSARYLNTGIQEIQKCLTNGSLALVGLEKILFSLETLFHVQKQGDWVAVADIIEYELLPLLSNGSE